jgi:hypothetical protein
MAGGISGWKEELERFLGLFLARLGHKARAGCVLSTCQDCFNAAANRARRNPCRRRYSGDASTSGCHGLRCRHQPPSLFVKERRHTVKAPVNQSSIDHRVMRTFSSDWRNGC